MRRPLSTIASACVFALLAASCRSTKDGGSAPQLGPGWSYERARDIHAIRGVDVIQSASARPFMVRLEGRSSVAGSGESEPGLQSGSAGSWNSFLVVQGLAPHDATASVPLLFVDQASTGMSGVAASRERFEFALPPGVIEDCAHAGARWSVRDGATQLAVTLSAEYLRGFLEALDWAAQVGPMEERARAGSSAP